MSYRPRWLRTRVTPQARVLRLQPGDTLVCRTHTDNLPMASLAAIRDSFKDRFPDNEVIVTNFDLSAIRAGR